MKIRDNYNKHNKKVKSKKRNNFKILLIHIS